jgi:predicted dehydrogenase
MIEIHLWRGKQMARGRLKVGLIGVGRVAMAHVNAAMDLKDQIELRAIADLRANRAKEIAGKFGVKNVYSDYHALLADREIEAVIVCLPNHLHHPVCKEAARALKHILVEKPMAMNLREADEMIEEARAYGVTLMVGQSRRFSDAMIEISKRLDEIGSPFRIDINFLVSFPQPPTEWWKDSEKAGGLVILLQGSHSVDTILCLLEKIPSTVFSISRRLNPLWEGEDEADIVLGFESGELATILEGEQIPSLYTVQLKEFFEAIRDNRPPIAAGEEVRKTMLVLDEIRRSDRQGKVVRLHSSGK